MKQKFYPLGDRPTYNECKEIPGFQRIYDECTSTDWCIRLTSARKHLKACATNEFRPPKAGEWYLSGAEIEAWKAPNDFTASYRIARIVMTKTVVTVEELTA